MRKATAAFLAAILCLSAGCGSKTSQAPDSSSSAAGEEATTIAEESTQPDPLAPAETTAEASAVTTTVTTTAQDVSETVTTTRKGTPQQDPLGSFTYNDDGTVVFTDDPAQADDTALIQAAQALYNSACRTEWNFTVGCPYSLSPDEYIEDDIGWRYQKITDEGITSISDILEDYYKVFNIGHAVHQLSELYIERDGAVYALDAARGRDYFYMDSVITGIREKIDNTIIFTVESHYSGSDHAPDTPETVTEDFTVVMEEDGTWKVLVFRLPY